MFVQLLRDVGGCSEICWNTLRVSITFNERSFKTSINNNKYYLLHSRGEERQGEAVNSLKCRKKSIQRLQ